MNLEQAWIEFFAEPRTAREFADRFGCSIVTARQVFTAVARLPGYLARMDFRREGKRGPTSVTLTARKVETK